MDRASNTTMQFRLTGGVASGASTVRAELLHGTHERDIDSDHDDQGQGVGDNAPWCSEVVQQATVKHLGASLKVGSANDGGTVRLKALGDDDAGSGEHCPASVQQLVGAVLGEGGVVLSEAQGIIAVAANRKGNESVPDTYGPLLRATVDIPGPKFSGSTHSPASSPLR